MLVCVNADGVNEYKSFEYGMQLQYQHGDASRLPSHRDIIAMLDSGRITDFNWRQVCYNGERPIFEFLTAEFINALGGYLSKRIEKIFAIKNQPVVILEIGAGDGRLTHFLRMVLQHLTPRNVQIIATDSGAWERIRPVFHVERLKYQDALETYRPQIVLCSWMPYRHDWTAAIHATPSVGEYILIGETDDGCCGDPYRTWGVTSFLDVQEKKETKDYVPVYRREGFQRKNLNEISRYQICRSDFLDSRFHSKTVSFRRRRRQKENVQK